MNIMGVPIRKHKINSFKKHNDMFCYTYYEDIM